MDQNRYETHAFPVEGEVRHPEAEAVGSLLHRLKQGGFRLIALDDGGEFVPATKANILSVDESQLFVEKAGERFALLLVLGNSPDEIVADYTYKENPAAWELEQILTDFSDYCAR